MEKAEILCRVRGRVQGVTYRNFAEKHAKHLALVGYVRNMQDFTVEIVAQGFPDHLEKFIEYLRKGPFGSHVSDVEVEWRDLSRVFEDFEIVY
ncbi:MAG: Acylphosphatase [Parcubacteria group bacterium GW2011_GWA2_51_10]|nr:MAG: Acylphosphatase [Parcubacteria group bacterium GW2011_GWA2_51_10]